jgi:putative serine protease PepD
VRRSIPRFLSAAAVGAAAVAAAFVAVDAGGSTTRRVVVQTSAAAKTSAISTSTPALTASQVYKQDSAGIVAITSTSSSETDTGTGIVLNATSGLILTNDHVVSGATTITVAPGTSPSRTHTATVVGEDPDGDLAVLKVDPTGLGLRALTFASSNSVSVGDAVYAIGNPYGLDETLTTGIVSALGRTISAPDGAKISGAIQTDAALNPGNSGGPLLNAEGDVIGINSQIASEETSSDGSQPGNTGVGFAIASNTATAAVERIESTNASIPSTQSQSANGAAGSSTTTSPFGGSTGGGSESGTSPYGYGYGYGSGGQTGTDPYGSSGSSGGSGTSTYGYGSGSSTGGSGDTIVVP